MAAYLEAEARFKLLYTLKCKNKAFSDKQVAHFKKISVDVLARKSLAEQAKMADFATKNTVDICSALQVQQYWNEIIRPTIHNMTFINTNQSGLGNMAYILAKIADPALTEEWFGYLRAKYPI